MNVSEKRSRNWTLGGMLAASILSVMPATILSARDSRELTTPIRHLVVIFQENVSFDHYFATYPVALNPPGEPAFQTQPGTPSVNGLTGGLLTNNPNSVQPFRLDRSQALTCDQNHEYTAEQQAMNHGLMNRFVEFTSGADPSCDYGFGKALVMGYYDGNTTTALWNYAQQFALSDNFFGTVFGPSTVGALNLIAGQTHGASIVHDGGTGSTDVVEGSVIADPRPAFDDCVPANRTTIAMSGINVGNLLNNNGITWGWFQGGFAPTSQNKGGSAVCGAAHQNIGGVMVADYIPHHEPFQYYQSTANPHHLPPTSVEMIGQTDQANHQYDLEDFWRAALGGHLPAVSFLKASAYQDGHPGYSDPLDEQTFLVETLNRLQALPEWGDTAVVITYDDSDGWYDHVMPPIISQSNTAADALTGSGRCGTAADGAYQARCGYGQRFPLLVISPLSKVNFVDHSTLDQSSILRFIEDNWNLGLIGDQSFDALAGSLINMFAFDHPSERRSLFLNPETGERATF